MNRIEKRFSDLKAQGRKALIPYVTAGDPDPTITVSLMHSMVESGADLIELGVPFSDPMADGPVIQAACERALKHGVSLRDVLAMVERFRELDAETPVVLMGYLNPIEVMGYQTFTTAAKKAGVDGVLIVDLPPEEGEDLGKCLKQDDIAPIFLLAPTSTDARIEKIVSHARGFVYYVSLKGVTGVKSLNVDEVSARLNQLRRMTDLPIGVGFGIRDADSARKVAAIADAVVVGSAIVTRVESLQDKPESINAEVGAFLAELRAAMDGK
ncbi:MAG: tryptophan synthase subunit alpha [Gammaproteobacteria bacterium]|nr:tryptophan synthase subunit alpha [Gammaproteobacteria bacterium]